MRDVGAHDEHAIALDAAAGEFANAPEMIPLAKEKVSRPLFAACVRVAAKSPRKDGAWQTVRSLGAALSQLSNPAGNC